LIDEAIMFDYIGWLMEQSTQLIINDLTDKKKNCQLVVDIFRATEESKQVC
jgi:hypothetical protein